MDLQDMKTELISVNAKLKKFQDADANSYTAQVAKSFHLGMVGGSGKNNYRLNKRREAEFNRSIEQAKTITALYSRRSELERKIEYIESGQQERDADKKQTRAEILAQWFRDLKPGDTFQPGGNVLTISKVSKKSILTVSGCKWTAYEVIGKEAAKLL